LETQLKVSEFFSVKRPGPIVIDVAGVILTPDDVRRIAHPMTGGVILFARNFVSRAQLERLTASIRAVREDVLICIDHEGGRVQRCKTDGFTHLPAMRRLGQIADQDMLLAQQAAISCGFVLAAELRACGVDFSFTPVLDLDHGRSSVIGDRALHSDPRVVTILAQALAHGLALAGMGNCGKHFPGHGFAEADSHVAMPQDERSLNDILSSDATPYAWMGLGLQAVMPAHVVYPQVDALPAGFSSVWLQDILRHRYGFQGVIFSDDLSMEGAAIPGQSLSHVAQLAYSAGCDMVLICNNPAKADELLNQWVVDLGDARWKASRRRIRQLFPTQPAFSWKKLQKNARYQQAKGVLEAMGLIQSAEQATH
jgi:beta-N-acetylhexosaminidase